MKPRLVTFFLLLILLLGGSSIIASTFSGRQVEFQFHGPVTLDLAEKFRLFMKKVGRFDTITIHIDSPGGRVDAMNKMMYYMEKYKDHRITCVVDRYAASAAANIALMCPNKEFADSAMFVFHLVQACTMIVNDACMEWAPVSKTFYPKDYFESVAMLQKLVGKYLSKQQWKALINGEDLIIRGKQLNIKMANEQ